MKPIFPIMRAYAVAAVALCFLVVIVAKHATIAEAISGKTAAGASAPRTAMVTGTDLAPRPNEQDKISGFVKLNAGRRLQTGGLESALTSLGINSADAEPLALAADDFNGDGYPDLVCGYRSSNGGFLVVYYGDV